MDNLTSLPVLMNLNGKVAFITGAGEGIGKGIACRLHEAGARVVLADINFVNAQNLAGKLNESRADSALPLSVDVRDMQAISDAINTTNEQFEHIDILVNNAGIYPPSMLADMSAEDFLNVINTNLLSVFQLTKRVAQDMIAHNIHGKIINITSIDAIKPTMIGLSHYDASKHAVWGFTKSTAKELAQYGITVNSLAPGGIVTPGVARMQGGGDAEQAKKASEVFIARLPMKRMGEPDDIAKVVLFLASELSSYMTGTQVVVDGGALLV